MLNWLSELPPVAIYGVLALLAAVENVLPPVPSDAAVALGAFLSHRGVTNSVAVFFVTWLANIGGAVVVYVLARQYGRRLFASPTGRRLLAPRSLAVIEREYLRFGILGIFLSRFVPGIRAVVPPFAGLVGLGVVRTIVPMALASAIWYGGIIMLGALLGAEWERINRIITDVNRTLAIVGLIGGLVAFLVYRLRKRRRERERVWHATEDALHPTAPTFLQGTDIAEGSAQQAAALLVLELAYADPALTPADRDMVAQHLRERWGLTPPAAPPAPKLEDEDERRTRFGRYAVRLSDRFGQRQRLALVERMWQIAFSNGSIGLAEDRLLHLAAELLGLEPADLAEVRRRVHTQPGR